MSGHRVAVHDALVIAAPGTGSAERACIRVDDGVISSIDAVGHCRCFVGEAPVVEAHGMAAMPGFVDGHRHTWQTVFRQAYAGLSIADYGAALLTGIAPHLAPDDIYVGTLLGALTAIDSGTTLVVDWAHAMNSPEHADAAIAALEASGVRAQFAYGIPRDGSSQWSRVSTLPHPGDLRRVNEQLADNRRIDAIMAARGPEMTTMGITRTDFEFARNLGVRISVHVGIGTLGPEAQAVTRLSDAGLLGPDITFIHLNSTTDVELDLIREAGAGTCIGPATELLMPGVGWPATRRLLEHGLKPALSVDTETATSGSMFDQVRAVLSATPAEPDALGLTAADALELATSAGADAIGLGDRLGDLGPGRAGDIILIDTAAVNLAPARDVVATVALAAHAGNVDTVIVDGVVRKQGGGLLGHDVGELADRARASAEAIAGRAR